MTDKSTDLADVQTRLAEMKKKFIALSIKNKVLQFGEFKLKSRRISPYFFNTGSFNRGDLLARVAECYAQLVIARNYEAYGAVLGNFVLFGPAYKGIPLVTATAIKLADDYNLDVPYTFNRKEAKNHGEGGELVGAPLLDQNVVIVDDVITAGTAIGESVEIIKAAGGRPYWAVIALDREEIADGQTLSAVQSVEKEYDIKVHSLINLHDLIDYLENHHLDGNELAGKHYAGAIKAYRDQYGIS